MQTAVSKQNGLPVRVIRGSNHDSPYSPPSGYSYDRLYAVEDFWHEVGKSGFKIWRFRLAKIPEKTAPGQITAEEPAGYSVPNRREVRLSRIIRDTAQARAIKVLYDHRCQMCGTRLKCPAGPFAEAAHIRPLGAPHNGPDTKNNPLPVSESSRVIRQRCHLDHRGFVFDRHGRPPYRSWKPSHRPAPSRLPSRPSARGPRRSTLLRMPPRLLLAVDSRLIKG